MRAIGYREPRDIRRDDALTDSELPTPEPASRNILVQVRAVSVNPVDTKMRKSSKPEPGEWKVLGWDAAGVVSAVGSDATLFRLGNEVFYAGAIGRPGTNSDTTLWTSASSAPSRGRWTRAPRRRCRSRPSPPGRALFDRLDVHRSVPGAAQVILIVGGAGGVGSIAI